jgi:signal transduction histidine kinase
VKEMKSPVVPAAGKDVATLVAHVQERREQERSQLSRMLHHDVSGMLAAARMDLSRVSARVADDELQDQLHRVDQLLDQVIKDARREMQRLRPALLDHFGLSLAVRHLIEETCRAKGVRYTMSLDDAVEGVEPELLIAAFRLVETLLAGGDGVAEFSARLAARRDGYVLELSRAGMPVATDGDASPETFDMEALRAWLRSLGAAWLESAPDGRMTIEVRLPRRLAAVQKSETPDG